MNEEAKPRSIGFIMDGNRRWARGHDLPTYEGHRQGGEVLEACIKWLIEAQIPHGVFYAFSTENWKRGQEEVEYLMDLFREWLRDLENTLADTPVRIQIIGRRQDFAPDIIEQMNELETKSAAKPSYTTTVWLALSYGGRAEIVSAVNEAIAAGEPVTEEAFAELLWTADLPDPDIIVRTSGEQRLSNFLTWRSTYSELYFIDKHWPALTSEDFADILVEYGTRQRRRGA